MRTRITAGTLLSILMLSVLARAQDMPMSDVLIEGKGWELVAEGFCFTGGECADAEGNFCFDDVAQGTPIQRISATGEVSAYIEGEPGISGMELGPDAKGLLFGS